MSREELAELKALAEALLPERTATVESVVAYIATCTPERILALIAEVERLREREVQS